MGQGSNTYTVDIKTSFVKRFDQNGTVWLEAVAHDNLIDKTPYLICVNQHGHLTADVEDWPMYYYIGVPAKDCQSGSKAWLQIGGVCEGVITPELSAIVGNIFSINVGIIGVLAGPYQRVVGSFGICVTEKSNSTTHDMLLVPEPFSTPAGGIG